MYPSLALPHTTPTRRHTRHDARRDDRTFRTRSNVPMLPRMHRQSRHARTSKAGREPARTTARLFLDGQRVRRLKVVDSERTNVELPASRDQGHVDRERKNYPPLSLGSPSADPSRHCWVSVDRGLGCHAALLYVGSPNLPLRPVYPGGCRAAATLLVSTQGAASV